MIILGKLSGYGRNALEAASNVGRALTGNECAIENYGRCKLTDRERLTRGDAE
jgi:hypothetical protein